MKNQILDYLKNSSTSDTKKKSKKLAKPRTSKKTLQI